LLAGGDTTSTSLLDGMDYLVRTQKSDGTWDEQLATGTGFPQVFYLCYHLYRNSFPLLALNTFLRTKDPGLRTKEPGLRIKSGSRGQD
jgi:squalene-hopene/tetraprenyl-beta-curcumene cyclase